jgi:HK97 family phage prohead protease
MSDDLDELAIIERTAHAPLELRSVETLDVRHPERIVEIVCAPYDVEQPVLRRGEWVVESFAPHSFDGVERRANRVKVNRDHDLTKTVGRAVALHPSRQVGLVAELRISRTPLGDETLELAADGVLDASVGFAPMPGGEVWTENRSRRRVERAWLGHIALVPDPAYEDAQALDVRSMTGAVSDTGSESATPRLDQVLARLRELGYSPVPK